MTTVTEDEVFNTNEAAAYLKLSYNSMTWYRYAQTGPTYSKVGRSVRYRRSDLDRWLDEGRVTPGAAGGQ